MVGAFISVSLAGGRVVQAFAQDAEHRLSDRKIARRRDRHDAFTRLGEGVQLAKHGNVVEARIGAGVGDHHQSFVDKNATAISHGVRLLPGFRRFRI